MTDSITLIATMGLALLVATTVFTLSMLYRHNDSPSRNVSTALILGVTGFLVLLGWQDAQSPTTASGLAVRALFAAAIGLLWSAFQLLGQRPPRFAVPLVFSVLVPVAVAMFVAIDRPDVARLMGPAVFIGFCVAMSVGLRHGPCSPTVGARLLRICLVLSAASSAALAALGFATERDTSHLTLLVLGLLLLAVPLCLVQMFAEVSARGAFGVPSASKFEEMPLIDCPGFEIVTMDRIDRMRLHGGHLAILVVDIPEMDQINRAHDRQYGALVLHEVARQVRLRIPAWGTIAQLTPGSLGAVLPVDQPHDSAKVRQSLEMSFVHGVAVPGTTTRVAVVVGIADTFRTPAEFDQLVDAARASARDSVTTELGSIGPGVFGLEHPEAPQS